MIKAKDLRIGNLVYKGKQYGIEPCTAYEIAKFESYQRGGVEADYYKEWDGVVLTEDLLLRFGFVKYKTGYQLDTDLGFVIWADPKTCAYVYAFDMAIGIHIDNAHHLQNVFYDLKGTELELK